MMLARVKCGYDLYEQEKGKFFQKGDVCVYIDIRMLKQQNMEIKKNSPCSRILGLYFRRTNNVPTGLARPPGARPASILMRIGT